MIEKEMFTSDASNQSIMPEKKIPRSILNISNVLPKFHFRSYPAVKDIRPTTLDVCEAQLKQGMLLEKLTGGEGFIRTKILKQGPINLVVDVGEESTRAFLFDVVEDSYRLVAVGESQTTFVSQKEEIRIGIRQACDQLKQITGLKIFQFDRDGFIRVNSNEKKSHAAAIVLPINHPLTVVVINGQAKYSTTGLPDFLRGYPIQIIGEVSIDDDGLIFPALDMVVQIKPDVVYVAGLNDNNKHLHGIIKRLTRLTRKCIPTDQQPVFINAQVNSMIEVNQRSPHGIVSNYQLKALKDYSAAEQPDSQKGKFADAKLSVQKKKILGFSQITQAVRNDVVSDSQAFGRIIQFLDASTGMNNGVLGINIEPSKTLIASVQSGELRMDVFPHYGSVTGISNMHENNTLKEISEWLPRAINEKYVEEYLLNKSLYPSTIPISDEDLDIEFALAQHILRLTIKEMYKDFQNKSKIKSTEVQPSFDRIIAAGGVFSKGLDIRKTSLAIMNGIQPTGATTLFLDRNRIVTALGAAAADNPLLAVQVLDSGIIAHLCTLITAVSEAEDGTPILKMRMVCQNGDEENFEIKKGDFFRLPISRDEISNLLLQPFHGCDVGMGAPGRGGVIRVTGGRLGVVIDARGRPLVLRREKKHRITQIKSWYQALDGEI